MLPVGYFSPTQDPPNVRKTAVLIDEIMALAQLAESVGYDGMYFPEHHFQKDAFLPNPVLLAGLVGMRTQRLKVGPAVMLAPLYHPLRLAEDAAVIDLATKGRFVCALGIGYVEEDFHAFGIPFKQRVSRTEECIEILRRAWTGEPFSYPSKYHQLENVRVTPAPFQQPGPPIWAAGWSKPGVERAGRMADGLIADPMQSLPVIKEQARQYREAAARHGRKPYYVLMRDCVIGESAEQVLRKSEPAMYKYRWYFENGAYVEDEYFKDIKTSADLSFERCAKDRLIAGSPAACRDQLQMWKEEVRPDYLILRMRHAMGPELPVALDDMRLFGEKVIPFL
ncbi:MAG: LLM class flavin-dependent oxidoreductase [Gammaproteobacteria bacterium]|nr:LLM class flavin-dependent oxidoreductase [Gammaproteobacteria bacterium]MBI5618148.1 LLM class flavin-dependent oxidoreductase [Gammaproteobacteria bacterium]